VDLFKQASEIKPAVAHYSLGNALVQSRTSEAIAEYKEAVRINPDYAEALNNLGSALLLTGRTAEAIHEYNQALQIDPAYAKAHNNLGNALVQTGRAPEAIDHYKEALRITPDSADAHNNLATALAQMGRTSEAIEQLKAALRIKPYDTDIRKNLTKLEALEKAAPPHAFMKRDSILRQNRCKEHYPHQPTMPLSNQSPILNAHRLTPEQRMKILIAHNRYQQRGGEDMIRRVLIQINVHRQKARNDQAENPAADRAELRPLRTDKLRDVLQELEVNLPVPPDGLTPAATLSRMCSGLAVPGITQVTAGWPRMYLRKNWLQLAQSSSEAHSGSALPFTWPNREPLPNGRLTRTATPRSAHSGKRRASAARLAIE
jgi:tetratricopeptide (TPR) repeat protein